MATIDCLNASGAENSPNRSLKSVRSGRRIRLNRIAEVRRIQGATVRNVARVLGISMAEVRRQEQSDCDLCLSDLFRWQRVLEVPIAELLVEGDEQLAPPVRERARMVRIMKTAAAIRDRTRGTATGRLVTMLIEQLVEMMPEVAGVTPWPEGRPRRSLEELGRTARYPVSESLFSTR